MKVTIISKDYKYDASIKKCVSNTKGISNLVVDNINHKFTFDFKTHNVIEGLREQLIALGSVIEFVYL